jgi:hypothetical protein
LGVPPWELLAQPVYWTDWGESLAKAEEKAAESKKRTKKK